MSWPRWYPGLELSSHHLVELEDYLLERSRYTENAFGVAEFSPNCLKPSYIKESTFDHFRGQRAYARWTTGQSGCC